jgi:hypothetical protein
MYALNERFQGSFISSYVKSFKEPANGIDSDFYETDSLMYNGSSGCPGFMADSKVIGMQSRSLLAGASPKNNKKQNGVQVPSNLLSISMWIPSPEIIKFAQNNGVTISNGGGNSP